jgi:succinate dehydrogenase / fumarate reductase, cytochrome b subunit
VSSASSALRISTPAVVRLWRTSIGKKTAVAVTGLILVGYLVLHMAGNLAVFSGAGDDPRIDQYSHWLREFGTPLLPYAFFLWVVRVLLLSALVIHITGIVQLRKRNLAAKPLGYKPARIGRSWAARTMMITGPLLLAFIVFHILQFTTLTINVGGDMEEGAVYQNLHDAFSTWWVAVLYLLALGVVGFHLRHGIWSLFQTLGIDSPQRNGALRLTGTLLTAIIVVGFALVPIFMWTGVLPAP